MAQHCGAAFSFQVGVNEITRLMQLSTSHFSLTGFIPHGWPMLFGVKSAWLLNSVNVRKYVLIMYYIFCLM